MANFNNEGLYAALEKSRDSLVMENTYQLSEHLEGRFNGLNLSSEMSFLIKQAARLCDYYASDVYYSLRQIEGALCNTDSVMFEQDSYRFVMGFRDNGVDHDSFILSRLNGFNPNLRARYRAMYEIEVQRVDSYYCVLKLYHISLWRLENNYKKEVV